MPGRGPTRRYTQEEEDELIAYFALSIDIPPSKRSSAHSYRDFTARKASDCWKWASQRSIEAWRVHYYLKREYFDRRIEEVRQGLQQSGMLQFFVDHLRERINFLHSGLSTSAEKDSETDGETSDDYSEGSSELGYDSDDSRVTRVSRSPSSITDSRPGRRRRFDDMDSDLTFVIENPGEKLVSKIPVLQTEGLSRSQDTDSECNGSLEHTLIDDGDTTDGEWSEDEEHGLLLETEQETNGLPTSTILSPQTPSEGHQSNDQFIISTPESYHCHAASVSLASRINSFIPVDVPRLAPAHSEPLTQHTPETSSLVTQSASQYSAPEPLQADTTHCQRPSRVKKPSARQGTPEPLTQPLHPARPTRPKRPRVYRRYTELSASQALAKPLTPLTIRLPPRFLSFHAPRQPASSDSASTGSESTVSGSTVPSTSTKPPRTVFKKTVSAPPELSKSRPKESFNAMTGVVDSISVYLARAPSVVNGKARSDVRGSPPDDPFLDGFILPPKQKRKRYGEKPDLDGSSSGVLEGIGSIPVACEAMEVDVESNGVSHDHGQTMHNAPSQVLTPATLQDDPHVDEAGRMTTGTDSASVNDGTGTPAGVTPSASADSLPQSIVPQKRKRGRPRKNPPPEAVPVPAKLPTPAAASPEANTSAGNAQPQTLVPKKRKRGRPKKETLPIGLVPSLSDEFPEPVSNPDATQTPVSSNDPHVPVSEPSRQIRSIVAPTMTGVQLERSLSTSTVNGPSRTPMVKTPALPSESASSSVGIGSSSNLWTYRPLPIRRDGEQTAALAGTSLRSSVNHSVPPAAAAMTMDPGDIRSASTSSGPQYRHREIHRSTASTSGTSTVPDPSSSSHPGVVPVSSQTVTEVQETPRASSGAPSLSTTSASTVLPALTGKPQWGTTPASLMALINLS
ncbi:hypothetical protein VKT23_012083 [Stygiomarasmius scandens]|uniref:Uncharacterized protein n=1 Tax=Marasmiellus scandens TaxID=2682957 RepID=A0ABR1J6W4_9AGAR